MLCKGRGTVTATACIVTTALVISSIHGFRMGLLKNFAELLGGWDERCGKYKYRLKRLGLPTIKQENLKRGLKCTKIMNAKGETHHIYMAPLFSPHLPVRKRDAEWGRVGRGRSV